MKKQLILGGVILLLAINAQGLTQSQIPLTTDKSTSINLATLDNKTSQSLLAEIEGISPDRILRESARKFLKATDSYQIPKSGDGDTTAAFDIYLRARQCFNYFERHQLRYGQKSADKIRPIIEKLLRSAVAKTHWIAKRKVEDERLPLAYAQVREIYEMVASGKPIPPPPWPIPKDYYLQLFNKYKKSNDKF